MVSRRISVSRVLELQVQVSWQEAVAIVGEVAARRGDSRAPGQPAPRIDPDACLLTPLGEVQLPFAAERDQPNADLEVLRALLAGREMPAELEAVAYGPPPVSLGDALAMFSRPSRRADIAAVALRAISAEDDLERAAPQRVAALPAPVVTTAVVPDDMAALRAQVGDRVAAKVAPPSSAAAVAPDASAPAARRTGVLRAASVAALLAGTIGLGLWITRRPPSTPADAPEPDALQAAAPLATPELLPPVERRDEVGRRDTDIVLSRPRPRASASVNGAPPQDSTHPAAELSTSPSDDAGRPSRGAVAPDDSPTRPAPEASPASAAASVPIAAPVYTWRSVGVEPPEMVFPRMPRSAFPPPGVRVDGVYVELLISESGTVEAVRLRGTAMSRASAYRHSMMLAAAKAWQFAPATRDNVPVRYVTRVLIEP